MFLFFSVVWVTYSKSTSEYLQKHTQESFNFLLTWCTYRNYWSFNYYKSSHYIFIATIDHMNYRFSSFLTKWGVCYICIIYCWFNLSVSLRYCFQLLLQVDPVAAGVQYDKEFTVCSLDLLSGLAEGLGSGIESLVGPFSKLLYRALVTSFLKLQYPLFRKSGCKFCRCSYMRRSCKFRFISLLLVFLSNFLCFKFEK